jgi:glycosyltransferase involved in cell wall biosynthesis
VHRDSAELTKVVPSRALWEDWNEEARNEAPLTRPSVSVALATYNGATHLPEQLADLARQSHLPCELIVCDDDSTDETLAILQDFADAAPFPVQIHRNPVRVGYRQNFVRCAGLCSGDLVAFCDQDDRWSAQKLETVAGEFRNSETMLVFHNARVLRPTGAPVANLQPDEGREWGPLVGPPWMFALGFTQTFRRSLMQFDHLWPKSVDQNYEGEPLAHDQWYFFLASVIGTIVYLPDVLADYRQHEANTYGWRSIASTLLARISGEARRASQAIGHRLKAAESRASILEQAAEGANEPSKSRLRQGSEMYREYAQRYRYRAALYESRSYSERGRAFRQLLASHAYGKGAWRIGPLGLAMDCLLGLTGISSSPSPGGDRP